MKKYRFLLSLVPLLISIISCQKPETFALSEDLSLSNIRATLPGTSDNFGTDSDAPHDEEITIVIPYYWPEDSFNRTSLDRVVVSGSLPNGTVVSPKLGLMDLSSPITLTLTAANGATRRHTLKAEIRKSNKALITAFKLSNGIIGRLNEVERKIYLGSLEDIGLANAEVGISPHASISPDPSQQIDYTNAKQFTVVAHDGTQVIYTVERGIPEKADQGFTSAKLLWEKSLPGLDHYGTHLQVGVAYSNGHLVIPRSDEWNDNIIPYYNANDGSYMGNLNKTGVGSRIFQVANDTRGKLLGCNLSFVYGRTFEIYKWDNVTAAPSKIITWNPENNGIAFDGQPWEVTIGRKLSVQGDLDGDAVIYATAGMKKKVLRWKIRNGVLTSQTPEILDLAVNNWDVLVHAEPIGASASDDYIVVGNGNYRPTLVNNSQIKSTFSQDMRFNTPAAKAFSFNNTTYIALADIDDPRMSGRLQIFELGSTFPVARVFDSKQFTGESNGNATASIAVSSPSQDGFTMTVYLLLTNNVLAAYELNCIVN